MQNVRQRGITFVEVSSLAYASGFGFETASRAFVSELGKVPAFTDSDSFLQVKSEKSWSDSHVVEKQVKRSRCSRSRIVLHCAKGLTHLEIAKKLGTSNVTVGKWRRRFSELRLDGLLDEARPGQPRLIQDKDVERVIVKTLESKPKNATHWSTRSMAEATGLSQTAISRIWRAFGLKPHRQDKFKISKDPYFIEKVRDVVGLYLDPPTRALVFCVDAITETAKRHSSILNTLLVSSHESRMTRLLSS